MKMDNLIEDSKFLTCHSKIINFNYDIAIDWAVDLLVKNIDTKNIRMIASFSKPVNGSEISPYLDDAITELNLTKDKDSQITGAIEYEILKIIDGKNIRPNLDHLYDIFLASDSFENDDKFGLMPFYLLYHAWQELDDIGINFYYEGVNRNNIEETIIKEGLYWLKLNT